jgi:hypothetical protein
MRKTVQFVFFLIAIISGGIFLFGELETIIPLKVTLTFGVLGFVLEIKTKGELIVICSLLVLCFWVYIYSIHANQVTEKLDKENITLKK